MPNGAFYTVASLPVENAEDFCSWCLTDFRLKDDGTPEGFTGETVMMAPAAGFYSTPGLGRNQVRMAYVLKKKIWPVHSSCLRKRLRPTEPDGEVFIFNRFTQRFIAGKFVFLFFCLTSRLKK